MMKFWVLAGVSCGGYAPSSHAFVPSATIANVRRDISNSYINTSNSYINTKFIVLRESSDESGGTEWIQKSMGSKEGDNAPNASPSSPANQSPEFTSDEIEDMNQLILSLSKESDDAIRREKLDDILDKELSEDESLSNTKFGTDTPPKFAKLFQYSLDTVGQEIQTAARILAEQQIKEVEQESLDGLETDIGEDRGEVKKRVKSKEELQLWALIDMMVHSKTRVARHTGQLGSKGEFR